MACHDFVPRRADSNQRGKRKAIRSGRNPLPMPNAMAPQSANCFSPFQHRQQQYATNSENKPRKGRNGPPFGSRLAYQKTGFTNSSNAAAAPAARENMRVASRYAITRHSALTETETIRKLLAAS